ncbi:MAG: glycosyl transferase, partial [Mycobacterium sp.]|nr:glycosyl transferase [Mycobacterium sp.]
MTPKPAVSVVIPTIGRATLRSAVESALSQTVPPNEVIVVVDYAKCTLDLPDSDSVSVLRTAGGVGAAQARQLGVTSSTGDVIALLDDDDVWKPDKLERQLAAAPNSDEWILSCRFVAGPNGRRPIVFPRRLIQPTDPVADYLFEFRSLRRGRSALQTSTLVFPRAVA